MEDGKGWGLEGVAAVAGGRSPDVALQVWIRASLNERGLGARFRALASCTPLLEAWYSRRAPPCFHALHSPLKKGSQSFGSALGLPVCFEASCCGCPPCFAVT